MEPTGLNFARLLAKSIWAGDFFQRFLRLDPPCTPSIFTRIS
jgi:hypothetical protein